MISVQQGVILKPSFDQIRFNIQLFTWSGFDQNMRLKIKFDFYSSVSTPHNDLLTTGRHFSEVMLNSVWKFID